jgi:hypothetical protein
MCVKTHVYMIYICSLSVCICEYAIVYVCMCASADILFYALPCTSTHAQIPHNLPSGIVLDAIHPFLSNRLVGFDAQRVHSALQGTLDAPLRHVWFLSRAVCVAQGVDVPAGRSPWEYPFLQVRACVCVCFDVRVTIHYRRVTYTTHTHTHTHTQVLTDVLRVLVDAEHTLSLPTLHYTLPLFLGALQHAKTANMDDDLVSVCVGVCGGGCCLYVDVSENA